jgi:hypothetical protein
MAKFKDDVDFVGIEATGMFSMNKAEFWKIPDFVQANFTRAPLIEHVLFRDIEKNAHTPPEIFRTLRSLAAQADNHDLEMDFFASELRSTRQRQWSKLNTMALAIVNLIYERFSDYGRSIILPLIWLGFLTMCSMHFYLSISETVHREKDLKGASVCTDISQNTAGAFLALQRSLIIPGLTSQEKRDQAMGCLYGWHNPNPANKNVTAPRVPNSVALIGIFQQLLSILLIFLCILAVRAKFRIR